LSFVPPPLILRVVSTGFIFPFSYMSTWYFHHIYPPTLFPYILLFSEPYHQPFFVDRVSPLPKTGLGPWSSNFCLSCG
jgi:hypothetical protein